MMAFGLSANSNISNHRPVIAVKSPEIQVEMFERALRVCRAGIGADRHGDIGQHAGVEPEIIVALIAARILDHDEMYGLYTAKNRSGLR